VSENELCAYLEFVCKFSEAFSIKNHSWGPSRLVLCLVNGYILAEAGPWPSPAHLQQIHPQTPGASVQSIQLWMDKPYLFHANVVLVPIITSTGVSGRLTLQMLLPNAKRFCCFCRKQPTATCISY